FLGGKTAGWGRVGLAAAWPTAPSRRGRIAETTREQHRVRLFVSYDKQERAIHADDDRWLGRPGRTRPRHQGGSSSRVGAVRVNGDECLVDDVADEELVCAVDS